jgi:hypothetical protein
MADDQLPVLFNRPQLYVLEVPSVRSDREYIPRVSASGVVRFAFELKEAVETKDMYMAKLRDRAQSTNDPESLALIKWLAENCRIVELVEH